MNSEKWARRAVVAVESVVIDLTALAIEAMRHADNGEKTLVALVIPLLIVLANYMSHRGEKANKRSGISVIGGFENFTSEHTLEPPGGASILN